MIVDLLHPLTLPITAPLTSAITAALGGSVNAFSAVKKVIQDGAADANILVIGDSTGDASTEWVYLFGQWLATQYPTHSVSYRLWNDAGEAYDSAVSLGTGSGSRTIRIWNASVSGSRTELLMGSKFSASISAINADAVIWNHGHNMPSSVSAGVIQGSFIGPVEQVVKATGLRPALILQNPNRDDSNMSPIIAAQQEYAALRSDMTLIDVFSEFNSLGKAGSLYIDNIHPSASGSQIFLSKVQFAWNISSISTPSDVSSFFDTTATNLLANGDFSAFSGVRPDSWLQLTQVAASKDMVIVDSGDTYSLKLENDAAANGRLYQTLSAPSLNAVKGGTLSVGARVRATTNRAGIFNVVVAAPSTGSITYSVNNQTGGYSEFRWQVINAIPVPSDATSIEVRICADAAATIGTFSHYSRIVAVAGSVPRDMP